VMNHIKSNQPRQFKPNEFKRGRSARPERRGCESYLRLIDIFVPLNSRLESNKGEEEDASATFIPGILLPPARPPCVRPHRGSVWG